MNSLPDYVLKSRSEPIRESSINRENWLEVAKNYRFHYTLEEQFRKAFVDYLLKDVSDSRKLYAECYCKNDNSVRYRNDNAYEEYLTTMLDPEEALKQIEQMVDGEDLQNQGISGAKETKIRTDLEDSWKRIYH